VDLSATLTALDMSSMFNHSIADFNNIFPLMPIYVSKFIQKSIITVDEKGTEAASATAVVIVEKSLPSAFRYPACTCLFIEIDKGKYSKNWWHIGTIWN